MAAITHRDQITPVPPQAASVRQRSISAIWHWLRGAVPTAIVVATLAGLAIWSHFTDWTMPKFSSLVGKSVTTVEDWCKEHNVPEAECIECKRELLPIGADYGWCKEHGVAQCPLEHPDVAQVKTMPAITLTMFERASRALALKPRTENNSLCNLHQRRIQFASTQAVEKVGIDIAVVQERPVIEAVVANGEVVYDQTSMAPLSSRVAGTVWRVEKRVGDRVQKGDILALVDAADVGRAKGEFLQAIAQTRLRQATVVRLSPLANDQVVAVRQFREAQAAYQEAKIRLLSAQQALANLGLAIKAEDLTELEPEEIARKIQFLGLPADFISTFGSRVTTSNLFPIWSPLDGVIIERSENAVEGKVIDTSTLLFAVADFNRMWLTLNAREEDVKYLSLGQPVLFRPNSNGDEPEVKGLISWISTAADDQTRTVKVRVDLPNPDGRLRANTFGAGRIVLREEPKAIVVPSEAVHWDGTCHVVFVRDKNYLQPNTPKFFYVRSVRPGVKAGDTTEIIAGLLPGEVIASKNSVVLEAQLLKSNLGAGCGCADGH